MNLKSIFFSVVGICFTSIIFGISIVSQPVEASCINSNEKVLQGKEFNKGKISK